MKEQTSFSGDDVKPSFLSYSLNYPIDRILLPKHKVAFLGYDGRPDAHHMLILSQIVSRVAWILPTTRGFI